MGSRIAARASRMPIHHLMVGTWTPPGAIFTFAFNDETLSLELVKRTEIPHDEPISWMTFDVRWGKGVKKGRMKKKKYEG
jgi:carboxy-cis,cis-muconate cyclase